MRIVTAKNLVLPESTVLPTGSATTVVEKLTGLRGFTLKVDGVLLGMGDKVPQGDVYEMVEAAYVPVGMEDCDPDDCDPDCCDPDGCIPTGIELSDTDEDEGL